MQLTHSFTARNATNTSSLQDMHNNGNDDVSYCKHNSNNTIQVNTLQDDTTIRHMGNTNNETKSVSLMANDKAC